MKKFILILLFLFNLSHAEKQMATFVNLSGLLSEQQKSKIPEFEYFINLALNGDVSAKLHIAYSIKKEFKIIGLELFQEMYDTYGYDLGDKTLNEYILIYYDDLATAYLDPELLGINPEKAYKTMIENVKNNTAWGKLNLNQYLSYGEYLPFRLYTPELLAKIWLTYDENSPQQNLDEIITEMETESEFEPEPSIELFESCGSSFADMHALINKYNELQSQLLKETDNQELLLKQAKAYFSKLETTLPNELVAYNFSKINLQAFLNISLQNYSMLENEAMILRYNDNLAETYLEINMQNVPNSLVITRIFETFKLQALCYKNWVLIEPKNATEVKNIKALIVGSFQLENTDSTLNLSKQGSIKWDDGARYQGELINGVPEGQGKYEFGGYELNGMFKNGLLNGKGEYIDKREWAVFSYKGGFLNGLYHGEGHYLDLSNKNDFNGTFIHGSFYGQAKFYFQRDSSKPDIALYNNQSIENDFIVYQGEMKAELPDGKGVCSTQDFKYDCEFYKGYLIGIGDYSLLPEYITK